MRLVGDKRGMCAFLFILSISLLCVSLQHYLLLGDTIVELITTMTRRPPRYPETMRAGVAANTSTTSITTGGDEPGILAVSSTQKHYKFIEFKIRNGWKFVKFPYHHHCKDHGVDVTVHLSNNAVDIADADLVYFSTNTYTFDEWEDLHHYRKPGQIWLYATQEPAAIIAEFMPPKVYRYNTFNWSFTFHSTSDIHGAYGWYIPEDTKHANPSPRSTPRNWHAEKPQMAVWVSTRHCDGMGWDRTKFVKDLGEFIHIDMYGGCGNLTIKRNDVITKAIFIKYKFHLSLENSCCSEYLTEKVWNALQRFESIPIVLGGTREEYRRLMPPHSYIHVDDFDSMEDLGRYIEIVGKNESLYNEYMAWRDMGAVFQQGFHDRFPVFKVGTCKIVDLFKKVLKESPVKQRSFDPYGINWFGSCYRCGDHSWIQNYNFWEKRTIFMSDWEDNRTLLWRDGR